MGNRPEIMGILNVTPDSFSDGGMYADVGRALERAAEMVEAGADIIDIGAESTRPGHEPVGAEEEMGRLLAPLRAIRASFPRVRISVDTYKGAVARAALEAGADIINDVWGGMRGVFFGEPGPSTAEVSAAFGCPIVLMHNRPPERLPICGLRSALFEDFSRILENASALGVAAENIILDGGFGFAKTPGQNLELLKNYAALRSFGFPLLLGLSRKSTLRLHFGAEGAGNATLAFDMWAASLKVCDIIRVHDVAGHRVFTDSLRLLEDTEQWTK